MKHDRLPSSPRVDKRVTTPFKLVHSNVWSPCPVVSLARFRYFVTFVVDYSQTTWLYLIKNVLSYFLIFMPFMLRYTLDFMFLFKV